MTPRHVKALRSAEADSAGGLVWNGHRWSGHGKDPGCGHGPVVVSDLVGSGYLAGAGIPGRKVGTSRRVLTDKGRGFLRDLAEAEVARRRRS